MLCYSFNYQKTETFENFENVDSGRDKIKRMKCEFVSVEKANKSCPIDLPINTGAVIRNVNNELCSKRPPTCKAVSSIKDGKVKQIDVVNVMVNKKSDFDFNKYNKIIEKLSKTKNLKMVDEIPNNYPTLISGKDTLCLAIEKSEDSREDTLKQIEYLEGFLQSVEKKLSNKSFVDNAPKNVVDIEKKKRDDAVIKLENLKKSI